MYGLTCDPVGTIVHIGLRIPAVGALMCVTAGVGGASMISSPDQFGGCDAAQGGVLMQVIKTLPQQNAVCAVPMEAPVQKMD